MIKKVLAWAGGALLLLASSAPIAATRGYPAGGMYGAGPHLHRFVLRDPVGGAPMPHTRYRMFLADRDIPGLGSRPVQGRTDARGRTASVRMAKRYPEVTWTVEPVIGAGHLGKAFVMRGDDGEPRPGMPYLLDSTGGYFFCGVSARDGGTYYVLGHTEQTVTLYLNDELTAGDFGRCTRIADAIGALPVGTKRPAVFRAMLAQYIAGKNELSESMEQRLREKLVALAIESAEQRQYDLAVGLGDHLDPGELGNGLINANWMTERGIAYIDQALQAAPEDPALLGSKAWGLFRVGRNDQALHWFERAVAAFGSDSPKTDEEVSAKSVVLTRMADMLWQLGRKKEARKLFRQAGELAANDPTLSEVLSRIGLTMPEETGPEEGVGITTASDR